MRPTNIPGKLTSTVYMAFPVTFGGPSLRKTLLPTYSRSLMCRFPEVTAIWGEVTGEGLFAKRPSPDPSPKTPINYVLDACAANKPIASPQFSAII